MSKILVTGCAGFIGFHACKALLDEGFKVIGIDNLSHYYDVELKKDRLDILRKIDGFRFFKVNIHDLASMGFILNTLQFDQVLHLAAQAGVRYSLIDPYEYINSNILGTTILLEMCKTKQLKQFVYASSSSVYGDSIEDTFREGHRTDHPESLYGATKKSTELLCHAYYKTYSLPCVGLRFFTVMGPWGRPDMATFQFTKAIIEGEPIEIYGGESTSRSFTYIDDVVSGIMEVIKNPLEKPDFLLYNIGGSEEVKIVDFVKMLEDIIGKKTETLLVPMQGGDVWRTSADTFAMKRDFNWVPKVSVREGLERFVKWYKVYYE